MARRIGIGLSMLLVVFFGGDAYACMSRTAGPLGQTYIRNDCPYRAIARFVGDSGRSGVVGPLRPGSQENIYIPPSENIHLSICNYDSYNRGSCSLR